MLYPPQFFDILGVFVFLFISCLTGWALMTGKQIPNWAVWVLFMIGGPGLFVDGVIVYTFYLR